MMQTIIITANNILFFLKLTRKKREQMYLKKTYLNAKDGKSVNVVKEVANGNEEMEKWNTKAEINETNLIFTTTATTKSVSF